MTVDQETIQAKLAKLRKESEHFLTGEGDPLAHLLRPRQVDNTPHLPHQRTGFLAEADEAARSDDSKKIDDLVHDLPMMEAIKLWGKQQSNFPKVGETSVRIRCPKPEHPDRNPSASAELVESVYRCHACQEGGDKYTLAAIHHGFGRDYQDGKNFVELKKKIAADLGYVITTSGGQTKLTRPGEPQEAAQESTPPQPAPIVHENPQPAPQPLQQLEDGSWFNPATGELVHQDDTSSQPAPQTPQAPQQGPTPIPIDLDDYDDEEEHIRVQPSFNWVPLGRNGSFLDAYMKCAQERSYPVEFGLAGALLCLSFIGNREITLVGEEPVNTSLGIVTVAGTGVGKSRALRDAQKIMAEVMPWQGAEFAIGSGGHIVPGHGVKAISGAASGENLIRQFEDTIKTQKGTDYQGNPIYESEQHPVNGLISFEELSHLVGKSSTQGSTMRERVMAFLDAQPIIENTTNTQGSYRAVNPFASLYTSVQPKVVHQLLNEKDENSGYINRLIFITGNAKMPDYGRSTPVSFDPAVKALADLKSHWDSVTEKMVRYETAAFQEMVRYQSEVSHKLKTSGDGMMGRIDVLYWKIITLLAINERTTLVTLDIVNKAKTLHEYLINTYRYVAKEIYDPQADVVNSKDSRILRVVHRLTEQARKKGAQTTHDLAIPKWVIKSRVQNHFSAPEFNRMLDALVETGELVRLEVQNGHRYIRHEDA